MVTNFVKTASLQQVASVEKQVLTQLAQARYAIWLSDVWFTNVAIYHMLLHKAKSGLSIEIIVDSQSPEDDEFFSFEQLSHFGAEIYPVNGDDYPELKENKFCVIDYQTVINVPGGKYDVRLDYIDIVNKAYVKKVIDEYLLRFTDLRRKVELKQFRA